MKTITFFTKLFKSDGKPATGVKVTLQSYNLASAKWQNLRTATSNSKGSAASAFSFAANINNPPMLRLISGTSGSNVLGTGAVMTYDKVKQALQLDFGEIEILAGQAFPLKTSNSRFKNLKMTVAGQERKAVVASAPMMTRMFVPMGATTAAATAAVSAASTAPELMALRASETTLRQTVKAKDAQLNAKTIELNNTMASRNAVNLELQNTKAKNAELKAALAASSGSQSAKESELTELRRVKADSTRRLTTVEAENAELKRQISARPDAALRPAPLQHKPIANVVTNFGGEMHSANQTLKAQKMPFKVSGVKIRVKGVMNETGGIALNDPDKTASAGSELEFSIEDEGEADTQHLVVVPDITNLTESLARRMMAAVGLRLEHSTQSFAKDAKVAHGECVNQSPTTGTSVPIGSGVFAVFAVKKEA